MIAGRYKGKVLAQLEGRQTRPMTDRIKETLFNILGAKFGTPGCLPDGCVLDVFAGTGGLGIEALSRGARHCTFVESHRLTLRTLRSNLDSLEDADSWTLLTENAWTMRVPVAADEDGYQLVFLDPPYRDAENAHAVGDLLDRIAPRVAPDGVMMLRVERGAPTPTSMNGAFEVADEREYGRMHLMFLRRTIVS